MPKKPPPFTTKTAKKATPKGQGRGAVPSKHVKGKKRAPAPSGPSKGIQAAMVPAAPSAGKRGGSYC